MQSVACVGRVGLKARKQAKFRGCRVCFSGEAAEHMGLELRVLSTIVPVGFGDERFYSCVLGNILELK